MIELLLASILISGWDVVVAEVVVGRFVIVLGAAIPMEVLVALAANVIALRDSGGGEDVEVEEGWID